MKRILLSVLVSAFLILTGIFAVSVSADNSENTSSVKNTTTQSAYTTAERTDDDPFAGNNVPTEKETPTFYYILGGVAGLIILFAIAGFITSKNKK